MLPENMRSPLLNDINRPSPGLRFCRNDLFVLAGIILLSLLTALVVFRSAIVPQSPSQTLYAIVYVDGSEVVRFDLSHDGQSSYLVHSPDGSLLVTVENGQAAILESDCPDKVCVHTGPISKVGQAVICLPLKTVLRIEATDPTAGDAMTVYFPTGESVDAVSE